MHFINSVWLVKHIQVLTTWTKCEELIFFSLICTATFKQSTLLLEAVSLVLKKCVRDAFSHLPLFNPINITVNWVSLAVLQLRFNETQAQKRHRYRSEWSHSAYYIVGNADVKQMLCMRKNLVKTISHIFILSQHKILRRKVGFEKQTLNKCYNQLLRN